MGAGKATYRNLTLHRAARKPRAAPNSWQAVFSQTAGQPRGTQHTRCGAAMADAEPAEAQLEELLAEQRAAVAGLAAAAAAGEGDGEEARAVRPAPPPLGPSGALAARRPRRVHAVPESLKWRAAPQGQALPSMSAVSVFTTAGPPVGTVQRSVEGWGHLRPGGVASIHDRSDQCTVLAPRSSRTSCRPPLQSWRLRCWP